MRTTKGADQPGYPRCLISAFVLRCLDSIFLVSISKISSLYLASAADQANLSLHWSHFFSWWGSFELETPRVMGPKVVKAMTNSVDPHQTAPSGAVWSGSILFAQAYLSVRILRIITVYNSKASWIKITVMILSFRTGRPGQTVQRNSLIKVYTICHSVCIVGFITLWYSHIVQILE